jgi:hypothetical protein
MYASNLFKQINKIIDDTVKVNITPPFQATAPFLLKQAQSLDKVGNSRNFDISSVAKLASSGESNEQRKTATPDTELPTSFPYEEWPKLILNYSSYDPNKPINDQLAGAKITSNPNEAFKSPSTIRQLFSHYGTGLPPYHDYVIANSLAPINIAGRSVIEDKEKPLSHSFSDRYTRYQINNLGDTPAINPVYGLSSKDAFINSLKQAETDYKNAKDNYIKALKSNATSEYITETQKAFDKAENYYGHLLHSYHNLLNRPFGHNYIREDDAEGKPLRMFFESDLRLDNHPAASNARKLLQQSPEVRYILAEKMADFYKDLINLRNSHFLAGSPIYPHDYATKINALLHSNVFARDIQDGDFLFPPFPTTGTDKEKEDYRTLSKETSNFLDDFTLKTEGQPINSKREFRFFRAGPATSDSSYAYTPEFIPWTQSRYLPIGEENVKVRASNPLGLPFVEPIRLPTSENAKNVPTELHVRPQIYRELPLSTEQNTGRQQQAGTSIFNKARDIIHDSLSSSTTSSLAQLSLLARAGLLEPNKLYAVPIGGKPRSPLYMKVQYTEPTAGYARERVSTGPPSLQPLTTETKDGRKLPKLYALSLVPVPTEKGIVVQRQEIPISESSVKRLNEFQDKLANTLVDVNTSTMINHLSSVVQKQLRERGLYHEYLVDQYISNILKDYKNEISTYKDMENFIQFAFDHPSFPGGPNLKNAVLAEFAPPGKIVVDPNTGKLYFNTGKVPSSSTTGTGK